ncbi:MAG: phage baseplate protein [Hyphomonadaceae bacterium]|nr:phage baseplate protein [Hyphomonadaceae bacterium]
MAYGISNITGGPIGIEAHLSQSIADILTTPVGSRVLRRNYGSRLVDLLDRPINGATIVELVAATAEALAAWEPRIRLTRVQVQEANGAGRCTLMLEYVSKLHGASARQEVTL